MPSPSSSINEQAADAARNMFPINEQFISAAKNSFEAQLAVIAALATKAIDTVEQLVDLNLETAQTSVKDSAAAAKQIIDAKDPQELLSVTVAQAQPMVAKAIAYSRQLGGITAAAQADITRTFSGELVSIAAAAQAEITRIAEERIAETGRKISVLVDEVSKTAPAGSENVVAVIKSAVDNTTAGYKQFTKSAKRAADAMGANLNTAVNQSSQTDEHAPRTTTDRARKG